MIAINLLPYELRPVKRTALPYLLSIVVLIIALAGMGVVWLQVRDQLVATRSELASHQKELDSLSAIVDEYERLDKEKKKLEYKADIIRDIVKDRIVWSRQLWNINRLTPDNFWYGSITEEEKSTRVKRLVENPKTKKLETKTVTEKYRVLELGGYVIQGEDATKDINPLMFNMAQDPEFSGLFQLSLSNLWDTEFSGYAVREFKLEYLIAQGGEDTTP